MLPKWIKPMQRFRVSVLSFSCAAFPPLAEQRSAVKEWLKVTSIALVLAMLFFIADGADG